MYQFKNELLSKDRFDTYMSENHIQFNYYNNYSKPLAITTIPNANTSMNINMNANVNRVTKIIDDIGWSCSIKSVQMLLGHYYNIWNNRNKIIDEIYKQDGPLSIHSFIKLCEESNCKETIGDFFGIYTVIHMYKILLQRNNIFNIRYASALCNLSYQK